MGEHVGTRPPMEARQLSTHGLLFVTAGSGRFVGPDQVMTPVTAPALIWLFPGVAHRYGPSSAGWNEHWVLFEGTAVRAYEALAAWRRAQPVQPAGPRLGATIAPLFAILQEATTIPGPRSELISATLTHALVGVAAEQSPRATGREDTVGSVADGVVAAAFGPMTVAERAQAAGLSTDQLRRQVAQETSLSVQELVIRTRVARAQELLAATELPVASVARQVGYDDAAYFSRLFTHRVGSTPTAFRRQALP